MSDEKKDQNDKQSDEGEQNEGSGDSSSSVTFKDLLSDEFKNDPILEHIKDADSLAKSYKELRKKVSAMISIPSEKWTAEEKQTFLDKVVKIPEIMRTPQIGATEEEVSEIYSKLGKPSEAKDYKAILSDDVKVDQKYIEDLKEKAFKLNMTQGQFSKYLESKLTGLQEKEQAFSDYRVENKETLKKEWGTSYESRLIGAQRSLDFFIKKDPKFSSLLTDELKENAGFLMVMSALGESLSEGTSPQITIPQYGEAPANMEFEMEQLMRDPAYFNPDNPNHKSVVLKVNNLTHRLAKLEER